MLDHKFIIVVEKDHLRASDRQECRTLFLISLDADIPNDKAREFFVELVEEKIIALQKKEV